MFRQLDTTGFFEAGDSLAIAEVSRLPADFAERFGLAFEHRPDEEPGPQDVAVLSLGGDVFRLTCSRQAAPPCGTRVALRSTSPSPRRALDTFVAEFRIEPHELLWIADDLSPLPWGLWRVDDNANRVLMARFRERNSAEHVARVYEARGHKQTYYVEPVL